MCVPEFVNGKAVIASALWLVYVHVCVFSESEGTLSNQCQQLIIK